MIDYSRSFSWHNIVFEAGLDNCDGSGGPLHGVQAGISCDKTGLVGQREDVA